MKMIKDAIQKPEINFWAGLIIPLIGVAVAWGVLTTQVNTLEERFDYFGERFLERQEKVDSQLETRDLVLLDIKVKLAEIQKDITYIKQQVD